MGVVNIVDNVPEVYCVDCRGFFIGQEVADHTQENCLQRQLASSQKRVLELSLALEFYADLATWLPCLGPDGEPNGCEAYADSGDRARKAIGGGEDVR